MPSRRHSTIRGARAACATFLFGAALLAQLLLPAAAGAGDARSAGGRPGFPAGPAPFNPAGNPPFNPAGPTPRNPAGPTPLNPTGGFPPIVGRQIFAGNPAFVQPQAFVAVVGPAVEPEVIDVIDGSFFCQVHGQSFTSSRMFFDHLDHLDGVSPAEAPNVLFNTQGVWVFAPIGE